MTPDVAWLESHRNIICQIILKSGSGNCLMRIERCLKSPTPRFRRRGRDRNIAERAKVTARLEHRQTGKSVKYLSYFIWKHGLNSKNFCISTDSFITCTHSKELHRLSDLFSGWSRVLGWSSASPDAPFHDRSWKGGFQEAQIKHKCEIRDRQAHYGIIISKMPRWSCACGDTS